MCTRLKCLSISMIICFTNRLRSAVNEYVSKRDSKTAILAVHIYNNEKHNYFLKTRDCTTCKQNFENVSNYCADFPVVAERSRASRGESIAIENGNLFMKANLVKTFAYTVRPYRLSG